MLTGLTEAHADPGGARWGARGWTPEWPGLMCAGFTHSISPGLPWARARHFKPVLVLWTESLSRIGPNYHPCISSVGNFTVRSSKDGENSLIKIKIKIKIKLTHQTSKFLQYNFFIHKIKIKIFLSVLNNFFFKYSKATHPNRARGWPL